MRGQVWPRSRPLTPSKAHTRAGRGEAACEQRGRVEGERADPREVWGVRPPPGAPLCPQLPGRAGAARVSSCDAPRAAPVTRAVSVLLGPKRPRNTPGQPPVASPAASRGLQCCTNHVCPVSTQVTTALGRARLRLGRGQGCPSLGLACVAGEAGAAHSAGGSPERGPGCELWKQGMLGPQNRACGVRGWEGTVCTWPAPRLWLGAHPLPGAWRTQPPAGAQAISPPDYSHFPRGAQARPLERVRALNLRLKGAPKGFSVQDRRGEPPQGSRPELPCCARQPASPTPAPRREPTHPQPALSPSGPGEQLAAAPRGLRVPARVSAGAGPAAIREGPGEEGRAGAGAGGRVQGAGVGSGKQGKGAGAEGRSRGGSRGSEGRGQGAGGGGRGQQVRMERRESSCPAPIWICGSGVGAVMFMVTAFWPLDLRTLNWVPLLPPKPPAWSRG